MSYYRKRWAFYARNRSYSMSEGAAEAYNKGYKPLSKWNKDSIINRIETLASDEIVDKIIEFAKKQTLKELKNKYLIYKEWHHVGKYATKVYFYDIDIDKLESEAM